MQSLRLLSELLSVSRKRSTQGENCHNNLAALEWLKSQSEREKKKKSLSPLFENYISLGAEISIKASARYYKVNFLTGKQV